MTERHEVSSKHDFQSCTCGAEWPCAFADYPAAWLTWATDKMEDWARPAADNNMLSKNAYRIGLLHGRLAGRLK